MSLVGQPAPEWTAPAYLKGEQVDLNSAELNGKWYVLYFYPLDFTFIWPTEINGFQQLLEEFEGNNVSVIGVSTDSFFSHNAWFADRGIFPNEITHAVIADTSHAMSKVFGVLKDDLGVSYRGTIIVDDHGTVRSTTVTDLSAGRSPQEVLRTVKALQSGGLCGANWNSGDEFVA